MRNYENLNTIGDMARIEFRQFGKKVKMLAGMTISQENWLKYHLNNILCCYAI